VAHRNVHDLIDRSVVAAHREDAVGDHQHALGAPLGTLDLFVERAQIEVRVDTFVQWPRKPHRVDDAIVVEFITDDDGFLAHQRHDRAHDRRVGSGEDHAGPTPVESRQFRFELDVGQAGAADEAHRPGPGAEARGGGLLGGDDVGSQRHAEVRVRVHADEGAVALSGEVEARAAAAGRRVGGDDDGFDPLGGAGFVKLGDVRGERAGHPVNRHALIMNAGAGTATCETTAQISQRPRNEER